MNKYIPKGDAPHINSKESSHFWDFIILTCGFFGILSLTYLALSMGGEYLILQIPEKLETQLFRHFDIMKNSALKPPESAIKIWSKLQEKTVHKAELGLWCESQPNAFALPGKKVFLTSGLLANIKTERGLAFVMAHELGHIDHRDHLRQMGRLAANLVIQFFFNFGESNITSSNFGILLTKSFDQKQEEAADAFGLDLVQSTYQTIHDSSEFFRYLISSKIALKNQTMSFLRTHPEVQQRLKFIEERELQGPHSPQAPDDAQGNQESHHSPEPLNLQAELELICPNK